MFAIKIAFLSKCVLVFIVLFDAVKECSGSRAIHPKAVLRKCLLEGITKSPQSAQELYVDSYDYNSNAVFDVKSFGAVGDGVTDDTEAFQAAWRAACKKESAIFEVPSQSRFLVSAISFLGPCQSNIIFKIDGNLIAPMNPGSWDSSNRLQWILFSEVRDMTFSGNGIIDGQGAEWWKLSDSNTEIYGSSLAGVKPTALRFYGSDNITVLGITITNSPQCHLKFDSCTYINVANITISSPASSPNTDGVHLQNSQHVEIQHSSIGCGDDCVSIQTGCADIRVHNNNCGPGHGISIGSLGEDGSKACVSNVTVQDSTIQDALNGVRIKTWQGGMGLVKGVSFSNIQVSNVSVAINIDQYYCDKRICSNQTSAVAISDITYKKISGTYVNTAIYLACSDDVPCTDLNLIGIELYPLQNVSHESFCWNSYGQSETPLQPDITVACLQAGIPLTNVYYSLAILLFPVISFLLVPVPYDIVIERAE